MSESGLIKCQDRNPLLLELPKVSEDLQQQAKDNSKRMRENFKGSESAEDILEAW